MKGGGGAISLDLECRPNSRKFLSPTTEKAYEQWRNPQMLPLLRVVGVISLVTWALYVVAGHFWAGINMMEPTALLLWVGIVMPTCAIGIFIRRTPFRHIPNFASSSAMVGVAMIAIYGFVIPEWESYIGAVVTVGIFSLWLPYLRLPPKWTVSAWLGYGLPTSISVLAAFLDGLIARPEFVLCAAGILSSLIMVSAISLSIDQLLRQKFVEEQPNIASRIQALCEPGKVLISDATWQLVQDKIECVAKGEANCKGVHYPIGMYEPA